MVHFVGAGCGAADLITVRGAKLLSEADVVIYAGSLVNPELLNYCKEGCEIHNSAKMTLEETTASSSRQRPRARPPSGSTPATAASTARSGSSLTS